MSTHNPNEDLIHRLKKNGFYDGDIPDGFSELYRLEKQVVADACIGNKQRVLKLFPEGSRLKLVRDDYVSVLSHYTAEKHGGFTSVVLRSEKGGGKGAKSFKSFVTDVVRFDEQPEEGIAEMTRCKVLKSLIQNAIQTPLHEAYERLQISNMNAVERYTLYNVFKLHRDMLIDGDAIDEDKVRQDVCDYIQKAS